MKPDAKVPGGAAPVEWRAQGISFPDDHPDFLGTGYTPRHIGDLSVAFH